MTMLLVLILEMRMRLDREFLQQSWALLEEAALGSSQFEHAAFALYTDDGHVIFARWPVTKAKCRAAYRKSVPPNAFAIVHTHPNSRPLPSWDDDDTARRLGMPVYVVTRVGVARTTGDKVSFVQAGNWRAKTFAQR